MYIYIYIYIYTWVYTCILSYLHTCIHASADCGRGAGLTRGRVGPGSCRGCRGVRVRVGVELVLIPSSHRRHILPCVLLLHGLSRFVYCYLYACMLAYVHTCIRICIYTYIHTSIRACICIYTCTHEAAHRVNPGCMLRGCWLFASPPPTPLGEFPFPPLLGLFTVTEACVREHGRECVLS